MTTIQSLQNQLNVYRDNPKTLYRHNDQLEELRNLQDRLQEEKTTWLKQKENQERELEEQRTQQMLLQEQIRKEQQDIQEQREQLYRKMEILSSQGLLISPSVRFLKTVLDPKSYRINILGGHPLKCCIRHLQSRGRALG